MAKTNINKTEIDWKDVKNKCRTTVNKSHSEKDATTSFKKRMLISEHSPIRLLRVNWTWVGIKSWVATHYSRHHEGIEKWISTQRSNRTGTNRDELPQGALVNMEAEANVQALINMGKVRLCFQASPETRKQMEDLKLEMHRRDDTLELSDVIVPSCIYRAGCPEFAQCEARYWDKFVEKHKDENLLDIDARYDLYNADFYARKKD